MRSNCAWKVHQCIKKEHCETRLKTLMGRRHKFDRVENAIAALVFVSPFDIVTDLKVHFFCNLG